jgi:hypothetical protein
MNDARGLPKLRCLVSSLLGHITVLFAWQMFVVKVGDLLPVDNPDFKENFSASDETYQAARNDNKAK